MTRPKRLQRLADVAGDPAPGLAAQPATRGHGGPRPGAGRPPAGPAGLSWRVTVRFSRDDLDTLERLAAEHSMGVTEWIRERALSTGRAPQK